MTDEIYFKESQKFKQLWLWLIFGFNLFLIQYFIFKLYSSQQIVESKNLIYFAILILLLLIVLLRVARLDTLITDKGVYIKFNPFQLKYKFYNWIDITGLSIINYSALNDYGGVGLRWNGETTAYLISGSKGLKVNFKNGKGILIGTNKENELINILEYLKLKLK